MQFSSEHYWKLDLGVRDVGRFNGKKKRMIAKLTNGRFMADPLPPQGRPKVGFTLGRGGGFGSCPCTSSPA